MVRSKDSMAQVILGEYLREESGGRCFALHCGAVGALAFNESDPWAPIANTKSVQAFMRTSSSSSSNTCYGSCLMWNELTSP